jgi:predicted homoserine dehydrogenase-like protein
MILVDAALERLARAGRQIRVGMVGAGFMGRGIVLQVETAVPGMTVAAICARRLEAAERAYREAGRSVVRVVRDGADLDAAIDRQEAAITTAPEALVRADAVDVVLDVTGAVEFGAHVALLALAARKHLVTFSAEMDATVGPVLKATADRAGVVYTLADGDQPGVTMNLYRFVRGIGVRPVLCGNIKGLHDPYRNPTTQAAFARRWGQNPQMVTSFADGTKVAFEQAVVANATGMRVARRGMYGPTVAPGTPVQDAIHLFPPEVLLRGPGIVDYVVGASPAPGVFVVGTHDHPAQRRYLELYKLGPGPLYCFYRPYHLCHFEVHNAIARAVLFGDATVAPAGVTVEVVATAKVDLTRGQVLDGPGGYLTYGQCENTDVAREQRLLPMGLAEGCRLRRDVPRDAVLTFDDVEVPEGRLVVQLWRQQAEQFAVGVA